MSPPWFDVEAAAERLAPGEFASAIEAVREWAAANPEAAQAAAEEGRARGLERVLDYEREARIEERARLAERAAAAEGLAARMAAAVDEAARVLDAHELPSHADALRVLLRGAAIGTAPTLPPGPADEAAAERWSADGLLAALAGTATAWEVRTRLQACGVPEGVAREAAEAGDRCHRSGHVFPLPGRRGIWRAELDAMLAVLNRRPAPTLPPADGPDWAPPAGEEGAA